jgi:hypothetical protein
MIYLTAASQRLDNFIGHGFKSVPGLGGSRQDLLWGQLESVPPSVAQFHRVGMDDSLVFVVVVGAHSGGHI